MELGSLRCFLKKYMQPILWLSLLQTLAMHGFLFSANYRLDSIIMLVSHNDEFNDLELGRFGIVYLNRLFGLRYFNPYLVAFLTMVFILLSGILLVYMIWQATDGVSSWFPLLMPFLIYLTPAWTEQLYFSYQSFLVLFGVFLTELAVMLVMGWMDSEKKRFLAAAIPTLFVAFSIYQALVPLYMTVAVGMFLLVLIVDSRKDIRYFCKAVLSHIFVGGAALLGYVIINKLIQLSIENTGYLGRQMLWGTAPPHGVIINIFKSLWSIVSSQNILDSYAYLISALCFLVALLTLLLRQKERRLKWLYWGAWLAMQLSAFAMIFILGGRTFIRTDLALTFLIAFHLLLAFCCVRVAFAEETGQYRHRLPTTAVAFVGLLCIALNGSIAFRLYYTDDIRYEQDYSLVQKIINRLECDTSVAVTKKPVVIIGEPESRLTPACLNAECIGISLFAFHDDTFSTNVILADFLATQGLTFRRPVQWEIDEAEVLAKSMTDFPLEGSVAESENVIVVRLSQNLYADLQYLTPGCRAYSDLPTDFRTDHLTKIDSMQCEQDTVIIDGFSILQNTCADALHYQVLLQELSTGKIYEVNTACRQRLNVAKSFWRDGVKYDSCGFQAKLPLSFLEAHPDSTFEVLLLCTTDSGETYYLKTDTYTSLQIVLNRHPAH